MGMRVAGISIGKVAWKTLLWSGFDDIKSRVVIILE
jgi:hypothetical protein